MRLFITGITSTIGLNLLEKLLNNNQKFEITVLINKQNLSEEFNSKVNVIKGDLLNFDVTCLKQIDVILHLASITPNNKNTEQDYIRTNVKGVENIIKWAEYYKIKKIVYLSSTVAISNFTDSYSKSKKAAENVIINGKTNWIIIRPPEIYGNNLNTKNFIKLLKTKTFVFTTNKGKNLYHPVYTDDLNNSIIKACMSNVNNKSYIISSKRAVTYKVFLKTIKKAFELNFILIDLPIWILKVEPVITSYLSPTFGRKMEQFFLRPDFSFDISPAEKELNYSPKSIEEWVNELPFTLKK